MKKIMKKVAKNLLAGAMALSMALPSGCKFSERMQVKNAYRERRAFELVDKRNEMAKKRLVMSLYKEDPTFSQVDYVSGTLGGRPATEKEIKKAKREYSELSKKIIDEYNGNIDFAIFDFESKKSNLNKMLSEIELDAWKELNKKGIGYADHEDYARNYEEYLH